jgi:hypothetical protein
MKPKYYLLIVLLTGIFFTVASCKKNDPSPVGFWVGPYSSSPLLEPSLDYLFLQVQSNGELTQWLGADTTSVLKVTSAYSATGNDITWTADYGGGFVYSYKGTMDKDGNSMTGTWGNNLSTTDKGKFSVSRQ